MKRKILRVGRWTKSISNTNINTYLNYNKWFDAKILLKIFDATMMNSTNFPSRCLTRFAAIALNINIIWKRIQFDYRFNWYKTCDPLYCCVYTNWVGAHMLLLLLLRRLCRLGTTNAHINVIFFEDCYTLRWQYFN